MALAYFPDARRAEVRHPGEISQRSRRLSAGLYKFYGRTPLHPSHPRPSTSYRWKLHRQSLTLIDNNGFNQSAGDVSIRKQIH